MKKLTLTIMALVALVFVACEVEPAGEDLEAIAGKGKLKKEKINDDSEECVVDLFPSFSSVVNICVDAKGIDASGAYFDLTINDTELAGAYAAWCMDFEAALNAGQCFEGNAYSSYSVIPDSGIEQPENFDLINWIINQNFVGKASSGGELFTFGDVQYAMWVLIDNLAYDCNDCSNLNPWEINRAQEIIDAALLNGEGYEPGIGDLLGVVIIPTDNTVQSVIIGIPLECEQEPSLSCETAFARGSVGNTCFIGEGFNRWGWTIGPLADGTEESYEVYAAAGQCDVDKGILVGTVDVSYTDGDVSVIYNINDGYVATETHTYAGNDMFPTAKNGKETVAPGQYYIEEDLSGEIYVIAHAVVCTDGEDEQ
ncbi:MAG: hypothetical protein JJ885_06985 [Muricauda sp.]|nr:hypothetical protein [Allomuricauda sp.]MBO6589808.1 hypothetical protein [Allomuricauda sp.]MBO6619259.1 hypothetical protein [Allomuricauda sp.]MBO6645170.1 hypothetical protein [Allomuricauda sp.]MBO6747554.1 hypothetical protein [Allomuricauda sp.]MBO6844076.1 hypothetical protein [Allomuricauda sp.]